jgi:hypothetical protein
LQLFIQQSKAPRSQSHACAEKDKARKEYAPLLAVGAWLFESLAISAWSSLAMLFHDTAVVMNHRNLSRGMTFCSVPFARFIITEGRSKKEVRFKVPETLASLDSSFPIGTGYVLFQNTAYVHSRIRLASSTRIIRPSYHITWPQVNE